MGDEKKEKCAFLSKMRSARLTRLTRPISYLPHWKETVAMNKLVLSIAVFLSALAVQAAGNFTPTVCVWTGSVSSDWNDSGNWHDGVRPGSSDVALFRSDASISPPDSFCGVIQLEGAVAVTAMVSAQSAFTLRSVSSSSGVPSFVKRGNGVLALCAARGINPGTVTVAEGSVDFVRNATGEPGAFDRIVIASGASARVADSPFASRHGVAVKAGFMSFEKSYLPEGFGGFSDNGSESYFYFAGGSGSKGFEVGKETQSLADRLDYMWDTSFSLTTVVERCFVPTETLPALCGTNSIPQELFTAQRQTVTYTRAIILSENAGAIRRTVQNGTGGGSMSAWVLDRAEFARCAWGGIRYDKSDSFSRGFHELNVTLWSESSYGWKNNWTTLSRTPINRSDTGYLTPDVLWYGVCCNALAVEEGATLTVADGQALGVARTEDLVVAGRILSTGPTACVSLLSSYAQDGEIRTNASLLRGFDEFAGQIEIGRTTHVRLPDTTSVAKWTLFGKGTVTIVSGSESRFGSGWAGTVDIPSGEVFDVPETWIDEMAVIGDGAIAPDDFDPASMMSFGGSVKLGDGDALAVPGAKLLSSPREAIPPPIDPVEWTYCGTSYVSTVKSPDGTVFPVKENSLPHVEEGRLVLTWAANYQRHAAILTGRPISAGDQFDFSFTVSASIPERSVDGVFPPYAGVHGWVSDVRAGNFSLGVSSADVGALASGTRPGFSPEGSCRLQFNFYSSGTSSGPVPYFGETQTGGKITGPDGGVDFHRPWRIRMSGKGGVARVMVSQDNRSYAADMDFRSLLAENGQVRLVLSGHSDLWENSNSVPWIRLEVSDFTGWVSDVNDRRFELSEGGAADSRMELASANWNYSGSEDASVVWPADNAMMLLPQTGNPAHTMRHAVCKTPFLAGQAFELSYDLTFSKKASTGTAAVWGFYLQSEGDSPKMAGKMDNGTGEIALENTPGYGIGVSTFGNKPYFWTGSGSKETAPIVKDFETQSIAIAANMPNRVTIRHDGCGTLSLRVESNGKTAEGMHFFEGLLHETKPMYLTFATGTAWADCGTVKISNLSFVPKTAEINRLTDCPVPLQIEPNASVVLNVGTIDRPPSQAQLSFGEFRIGDGADVTVAPALGASATHVSVSPVVEGNVQILSAENAVTSVSDVKFESGTPATLSLVGASSFAETFTATVPSSWFRQVESSHVVIDFSEAILRSAFPLSLVLRDETGNILDRPRLVRDGNTVKLIKNGFAVILR